MKKSLKSGLLFLIMFLLLLMVFWLIYTQSHDKTDTEVTTDIPVNLTEHYDSVLDWSYAAGYCGKDSFTNALKTDRLGVDLDKIPTEEEFLTAKLEEYGYPYVQDGTRFFIFYYQDHDKKWQNLPHGESTVAKSGCGTLCLSMVLTSLTGDIKSYTPDKLARYIRKNNINTPNISQKSIPYINKCLKTGCQIKMYQDQLDFDLVDKVLKKGGYIILDQMAWTGGHGTKIFGGKNHYIVIRGGNQNKGYYIANPLYGYSKKKSKAQYAPQNTTRIPASRFCSMYYYTILPPET